MSRFFTLVRGGARTFYSLASAQKPNPKTPNQDLVCSASLASHPKSLKELMQELRCVTTRFEKSGTTLALATINKSEINFAGIGDALAILALEDESGIVRSVQLSANQGLENQETRKMCQELGLKIAKQGSHWRETKSGTNVVCFGHSGIYNQAEPIFGTIRIKDLPRIAGILGLNEIAKISLIVASDGLLAEPDPTLNGDVGFNAAGNFEPAKSSSMLLRFNPKTRAPNSLTTNSAQGAPLVGAITENLAQNLVANATARGNGDDCSAASISLMPQQLQEEATLLMAIDGNGAQGHEVAKNIFETVSSILGLTNIRAAGVIDIAGSEVAQATKMQVQQPLEKQKF
jgi:hypothetical protein